jgi:CheY-like chemotaxis protein
LAIARQLVELQGGTLRAHSDGPGRGATFTIRLPLSHDAASSVPAVAGEPVPERLRNVHVLLVDDDPRVREPMGLLLEAEGAKVEYAASAEMAWAALLRDPPQVLVSDVAMPGAGGDGYSLVRRLRAQAPPTLRDLPAVALTAYAREIDRTRALDAGFNMHIPKPVDFDQLVIGISALSAGRARRRAPAPEPRPKRTRSRAGTRTSEP